MKTPFERIFVDQLKLKHRTKTKGDTEPLAWRHIEQQLVSFFKSLGVTVLDTAGDPTVRVVRHFEGEEAVIIHVSLERLARLLAEEVEA